MKTRQYLSAILLAIVLLASSFVGVGLSIKQAHADSTVTLTIKYANDTSKSATISVSNGEKYTLSEEYSWVRDQTSRYNLKTYSIDNGPYVDIPRVARGNFTLDMPTESNHEIVFFAAVQYPIEIVGTDSALIVPPSATNDNWFDADSYEQISVPYVVQSDDKNTRTQLKGWSYDGEDTRQIKRLESGTFSTPQIHMSNNHSVNFVYVTQYYLDMVSEYGHTTGSGWYDSGTNATIYSNSDDGFPVRHVFSGWSGPVLDPNKQTTRIVMEGPVMVTANWTVDYTPMILLGALVAGAGSVALYKKRRTSPSKEAQIAKAADLEPARIESKTPDMVSPQMPNGIQDNAYSKEIEEYVLQKSMTSLELFETSGILSKEKGAKIKEKMAASESDW